MFTGEGFLAIAKALLKNGAGDAGGYQGVPISHLMEVRADAQEPFGQLGVRFGPLNEAGTGAAVHCVIRRGVNVGRDALANLLSGGVTGGALVILGEDCGAGARIMQERGPAVAMTREVRSLKPRPNLPLIVNAVGEGFALSAASSRPVMVRIRFCHVTGQFVVRDEVSNPRRVFVPGVPLPKS